MVYFIRMAETDYIKIGRANDVKKRLSTLSSGCPFPLFLVDAIEPKEHSYDEFLEEEIHLHLKEYRVRGEWFSLDGATLTAVIRKFR